METPLKKPSDLGWSETLTSETIPRRSSSIKEISLDSEIEKSYNFFNTSMLRSSEI